MTSNPRREWKSFLWVDKWLVRLRIRSLRMATWTSGDPVSLSLAPYPVMSACLRSPVIDIDPVPSAIDNPYRSKTAVFDPGQSNQSLVVPGADDHTFVEPVEVRPFAGIARRHPLSATQTSSFCSRPAQRRDVVQRGLDWKQMPSLCQTMPILVKGIQRNRLRFSETPNRETTQFGNVGECPERFAEIANESADVGTLADERLTVGMVAIGHRDEPQRRDLHRPRR